MAKHNFTLPLTSGETLGQADSFTLKVDKTGTYTVSSNWDQVFTPTLSSDDYSKGTELPGSGGSYTVLSNVPAGTSVSIEFDAGTKRQSSHTITVSS